MVNIIKDLTQINGSTFFVATLVVAMHFYSQQPRCNNYSFIARFTHNIVNINLSPH